MPTLTVDNRSNGFSIQWYENKKRKSIFLSGRQYRQKTAETLKEMVETLVYYRRNGITIPDKSTERLLVLATPEIQAKLAKVGLISIAKSKTCRELWDSFINQRRPVVKPSSLKLYQRSQQIFFESFSVNDSCSIPSSKRGARISCSGLPNGMIRTYSPFCFFSRQLFL